MNTKEQDALISAIDALENVINELTAQKTELEVRIDHLKDKKDALVRLLPTDERINRLFCG